MSARNLFLVFLATFPLIVQPLHAQSEARVKVVQPGINRLNEDLKYLVELSPVPNLNNQWAKTLKDLVDSFAVGLDPMKPMRVDLVFGKQSIGYEMHFPVSKLAGKGGFLDNLNDLGYKSLLLAAGLFALSEGNKNALKDRGFLRGANGYASIAPTKEAIPANMSHPITAELEAFLAKGNDLTAELKNDPTDKAGLAARLANFKELRKQLEAGIKFNRNEDKLDFELRKLAVVQNLNQAERFLVETELLTVNWVTDVANKKGLGELTFSAIPNTDLQASANLLAAKSSYFANVKAPAMPAATGRFNFAIDPLGARHLQDFYKVFRPVLAKRVESLATLKEAAQKAAAKKASDLLINMLDAGIAIGAIDGFADLSSVGDNHTFLCGIRAADGKVADEILNLLPQIRDGFQIKLDVANVAGTSLHSVVIPAERLPQLQKFFPGETVAYVATSKDAVWLAIGANAETDLTAAINAANDPPPPMADSTIGSFSANMSKLVDLWDALQPKTVESKGPKTPEQKQREKIRSLATQATAGCEPRVSGELKRNGDTIDGKLDVSECALKFVGTMIADVAKSFE